MPFSYEEMVEARAQPVTTLHPRAWTVKSEDRILWVLGYDGPMASFEEADRAYCESDKRRSIDPDPARHLAKTETKLMASVLLPSD